MPSKKFISHKLIKPKTIEARLYQEVLVSGVLEHGNSLVVAPAALGKTIVAVMLSAHVLSKGPKSKVLFLAPTKPLAVQHEKSFKKFLNIAAEQINLVTGSIQPKKRKSIYSSSRVISATPQTIENDIINSRIDFSDFELIIFDEAHRAVENYSYVFLAKEYAKHALKPLILALTASPGSTQEKIDAVCNNLFIQNIEIRGSKDDDVKPYVQEIEIDWVYVKLPESFVEIKSLLEGFLKDQLKTLRKMGLVRTTNIRYYGKRNLLELQSKIRRQLVLHGKTRPSLYGAASVVASILKVSHAHTLLETQGIAALQEYFGRLLGKASSRKAPKAVARITQDPKARKAVSLTKKLYEENVLHPKFEKLSALLVEQFGHNPESKVLVFNHYRDSVNSVVSYLEQFPLIKPRKFIGQATKEKDKGMSQKEQTKIIEELKEGKYNTLVATSVAEEGLDIPAVDLVVFFEAVPSEIRTIQRRGRTGRFAKGRVVVLMAKGTRDEAFHWASQAKERRMKKTLKGMKKQMQGKKLPQQSTLVHYAKDSEDKIIVYVDSREQASSVVKELHARDAEIKVKQLDVGDYVLSDQIVVERKTISDFLQSIVDGRLFSQLVSISSNYDRPLLLLEGDLDDLFTERDIHRNAIIGALTSIATTYRVPILFASDAVETAEYLFVIAKREQLGKDKDIKLRIGRKGLTLSEQQQFIVESLPLVGPKMARKLLEKFGSIEKLINANIKELQELENMGPKKAENIKKVLTSKYKAQA